MRVFSLLVVLGIALAALIPARADGVVASEAAVRSCEGTTPSPESTSLQPSRTSGGASAYLPMFGNRRHAELLLVGEYTLGETDWAAKTRLGVVASDAGLYGLKLSYELIENRLRAAAIYFDGGDFSVGLEVVAVRKVF